MHSDTLAALACPQCDIGFEPRIDRGYESRIEQGQLLCPQCRLSVPVVAGFALFNEASSSELPQKPPFDAQLKRDYEAFLRQKTQRGAFDLYAAFQPFNESTRALYPLLPLLEEVLQPGDVILDTWCRTGWSGELLAGLFPQQRVVSIWESNSNVLGYRGFAYWLAQGQRAPNLDIVFTHPDKPLPFASNSVRVVHGLDSLHRYHQDGFAQQCLRVCQDDGLLVFPHIHLTNAQPQPFFERGCFQYHGREWSARLKALLAEDARRAWVLAEPYLFTDEAEISLHDQSDTSHYNALILIASSAHDGRRLAATSLLPITANSRLVLNPLLHFDLQHGQVDLEKCETRGPLSELLQRHPPWTRRLEKQLTASQALSPLECRLLWHAQRGLRLQDCASLLHLPLESVIDLAQGLAQRELVHPAPVSAAMARLQHFYGWLQWPSQRPSDFAVLWASAIDNRDHGGYGERPVMRWLADGSELRQSELVWLVNAIRHALARDTDTADAMAPGEHLLLVCDHHPEALLLCWAAWLSGISVVLADPGWSDQQIAQTALDTQAKRVFSVRPLAAQPGLDEVVVLDDPDDESAANFSQWLAPSAEEATELAIQAKASAEAAVLFSSGSSGRPKGIALSQRALCYSAHSMVSHWDWQHETLLSLGPLSMMSGLRNPALAALMSHSTIVVPERKHAGHPIGDWQSIIDQGVSVVSTVPAWLNAVMEHIDRLDPAPRLRQLLLSGAPLAAALWEHARQRLNITVGNYYGLTETAGICAANTDPSVPSALGAPVNALLHLLDDSGQWLEPGVSGQLMICSDQLMDGYLETNRASGFRDGAFASGDRAHWDEHRQLILEGRGDDALKLRNGRLFYPQALESQLLELPQLIDAAVTVAGEAQYLVALVVSRSDINATPSMILRQWQHTASDLPRPQRLFLLEQLPRTTNGKLRRDALRTLAETALANE